MFLATFSDWLTKAPLWAIGLVVFGGMAAAALVGWWLRRRRDRRSANGGDDRDKPDGEQGTMVSAVMGLLALLIAFTFSIALDRYDTRRGNVLLEANAIGTTYLRAQLLDEPHRSRISRLLADYTDARISLGTAVPGPAQRAMLETSDQLIADLWTATVSAFPSMRPYDFSSTFVETMNNLIDMDAARKAGRQAHVPSEVFLVLFLYQFTAAGVISYALTEREGRRTGLILFLLFGSLLLLIIDVDRPTTGGITESQEPMLRLRTFLKAQPPESFDRFDVRSRAPVQTP